MQSKLFQQRLKGLRKEKGITLERLAKEIGTTKVTLSRYENGDRSPKLEFVAALSNYFNVEMTWLAGVDNSKFSKTKNDNTLKYKFQKELNKEKDGKHTKSVETFLIQSQLTPPRQQNVLIYAKEQLEEQNNTKDNIVDFNDYKDNKVNEASVYGYASAGTGEQLFDEPRFKVNVKGYIPPHDLALQVNGDSMEPVFRNGEIIFVEKTHDIKNGQIGVFIINGEAYVKKVRVEDDRLTLISLNKNYKDLHFYQNEGVQLVGKVIL